MRRKSQVAGDLFKGSFNRFKAAVRVDIQRHTGIGVSHQVLQAFYIQPGLLDIGAEGVSQHMRCNAWNRLEAVFWAVHPVQPDLPCAPAGRVVFAPLSVADDL